MVEYLYIEYFTVIFYFVKVLKGKLNMCDNEIKSMLKTSNISIATITYLNQSTLITDICNVLFQEKNNFSLSEIQNSENQDQFKIDIEEHFEWINEHCTDSTNDFNDYSDGSFFDAYEVFYDRAIDYIYKEDIPEELKNNLINYFLHIKNL